ncbi:unnamed protein product [Polarella glacialis]|uniref:Uncharacterized protein n=1 Tax=Polarella glacialis TaxID=89957 RepID=A0A813I6M5_POLGL|nr:unnamed protein product [Polarella glacialis]CAE8646272.1 unnamed protein product [Polarella glacialis]CAE8702555.1 unnamed protein product [Polarella glacialis]
MSMDSVLPPGHVHEGHAWMAQMRQELMVEIRQELMPEMRCMQKDLEQRLQAWATSLEQRLGELEKPVEASHGDHVRPHWREQTLHQKKPLARVRSSLKENHHAAPKAEGAGTQGVVPSEVSSDGILQTVEPATADEAESTTTMLFLKEDIYTDVVMCMARRKPLALATSLLVMLLCVTLQFLFVLDMVQIVAVDDLTSSTDVITVTGDKSRNVNIFSAWAKEPLPPGGRSEFSANFTMVDWVCSGSSWSWYGDKVTTMDEYHRPWRGFGLASKLKTGVLFGCLVVFVWGATVIKKLRSALSFAMLITLPRSNGDVPDYEFDELERVGHLHSLSFQAKAVVILITIIRCVVCGLLLHFGALFLVYTGKLTDFILNTVALAFIFDFETLFFEVFLAHDKQVSIHTLAVPQGKIHRKFASSVIQLGHMTEIVIIIVLAIVVLGYERQYLSVYANVYYEEVYKLICPRGMSSRGTKPVKMDKLDE